MSITIQTEGRRTYLAGNTYPHRDAIRSIGAHWDADRKMWWTAKRDQAQAPGRQARRPDPLRKQGPARRAGLHRRRARRIQGQDLLPGRADRALR